MLVLVDANFRLSWTGDEDWLAWNSLSGSERAGARGSAHVLQRVSHH